MKAIRRTLVAAATVAAVSGWALPLQAGPLLDYASYAYIDQNGAWYGATPYSSSDSALEGTVDWVVFGPGGFAQAFPGSSYSPPANQLVYAYQVVNAGSSDVSTLSLGIVDGRPYGSIGWFPLTNQLGNPGMTPTTATFIISSPGSYDAANWNFSGGIATGQVSAGLAYASPNAPEFQFGTLINSGLNATAEPLPSPSTSATPEPATFTLLGSALLGLGVGYLRRRRAKA
jgi:hypothetical protein